MLGATAQYLVARAI